jgi:hypothetical protein
MPLLANSDYRESRLNGCQSMTKTAQASLAALSVVSAARSMRTAAARRFALGTARPRQMQDNSLEPKCSVQPIPAITSSTAHTAAVSSAACPVAIAAA